jgi:Tol biopolymer transport system component
MRAGVVVVAAAWLVAAVSLVSFAGTAAAEGLLRPVGTGSSGGRQPIARNGRWIAYSTAPACAPFGCGEVRGGSDVLVTRVGGSPTLVAGRGRGKAWNICPAFSPNGRMLAFARMTNPPDSGVVAPIARATLVVVRVGLHGPIGAGRIALSVPGGHDRCPRWSADSSRLAYLDHGRVVVRGLDGSTRKWRRGDPALQDFKSKADTSPMGDLIATPSSGAIVVSRPDGSDKRLIPDDLAGTPSYAIAGWSPDSRKLLLMTDVGGGFNMRAVSVEPPFASETVVAFARVNDERSWPGYGDVSWQPRPRT